MAPSPEDRTTLEGRLDVMKQEIDALQIEVMRGDKPWYRQIPVLIPLTVSVLALVFSFATTYISERRVNREQEHSTRVELRGLIQRLSELPKENFELNRKYAQDAQALSFLGALINTENLVMGTQAADLISELPGGVTASEYHAVTWALYQSGQLDASEALLDQGIAAAEVDPTKDFPGYMALLRQRGNLSFSHGRPEEGREVFRHALGEVDRHASDNPYVSASAQLQTRLMWASAELSQRECDRAQEQIDAAREHLPWTALPAQRMQVETFGNAIEECDPTSLATQQTATP